MSRSIELQTNPSGQTDRGAEQGFAGFDGFENVEVLIASAEWDMMLLAHSDRDSALLALERFADQGEPVPNPDGRDRIVRVRLPRH